MVSPKWGNSLRLTFATPTLIRRWKAMSNLFARFRFACPPITAEKERR